MATDPTKGSTSGGDETIEQMMKRLGIVEDDLDDVVYEEEGSLPAEATRWLAIARVFTDSEYSSFWFFKNMRTAWDLAQQVETRFLDSSLHTFQFKCLGDWERVMERGPWNFRDGSRKRVGMSTANPLLEDLASDDTGGTLVPVGKGGLVGSLVNQIEPLAPPSPNPVRDPKRKKIAEEERMAQDNTTNGTLADSLGERRQAQ
ncbi:hypothetical protein QYE76_031005 [Lolium multiflorum]|uniref:DUF4283 domain-containing protein n=1 Tax=Lolium multiflorum TaxID=4521 RepID=A0AAD8QT98_LOLMU|nr:hypothetical protein QYE76_031005 [Lolium multiflorum]